MLVTPYDGSFRTYRALTSFNYPILPNGLVESNTFDVYRW